MRNLRLEAKRLLGLPAASHNTAREQTDVVDVATVAVHDPEPWSDSLTANPGQRLTVPDSLTALTALSLTV